MGCHFLLLGIIPTQGLNPHLLYLLHCRQILYPLSHWGSPWCIYTKKRKGCTFHINTVSCQARATGHPLFPHHDFCEFTSLFGPQKTEFPVQSCEVITTTKWHPTPVFLPGESQGRGSLVGCRLWGRTESDTTEVT